MSYKIQRIEIIHVADGALAIRRADSVPRKGDWIKIGSNTYEVKRVIWDYGDAVSVTVIVDDPKE